MELEAGCRGLLGAQKAYSSRAPSLYVAPDAAFGCALYDLLPEDRFDSQPWVHSSGQWMLVADGRLDNRDELLGQLGIRAGAEISDSEVLFRAYARWGAGLYPRVIGDFAFAVFDRPTQSLTLARDHAGQRPLHYHLGDGFVAFASMPGALQALPQVDAGLEKRELALFICDVPRYSSQTFFRGIKRVEPGRAVTINRSGAVTRACWEFPEKELYFPRQGDYVEAFREQLDRATRSRMRGPGGTVAAHLSAGLDSSAVAATAAKLDPASKVLAITSAPRVGFEGPAPSGRLSDESGLASETAALYPNMEHLVLRSEGSSPLSSLGSDAYLYQEPTGYPCNHSWWSAANQAASARGIQIMLTGEMGNLTISAGNLSALADYLRAGQWARWWKEAKASAAVDGWRWRGVLASSFGPWIPRSTWVGLNSISSGDQAAIPGLSLLLGRWQAELASVAKTNARSRQFEGDQRRLRWKLMQWGDPGNFRKGMLARWGIDERDPTADRRLAEFCLSLPPEQLLSGGIGRRLGRLALADRLPAAVLAAPRGYQYADWYEAVDPAGLMREIDHLEAQLGDASVLDLRQLKVLAGSWPNSGWDSLGVIGTYRILLLRAIAAGTFESAHCK